MSTNADNLVLTLKTTISNMLKSLNEKLAKYLATTLQKILEKGGN